MYIKGVLVTLEMEHKTDFTTKSYIQLVVDFLI